MFVQTLYVRPLMKTHFIRQRPKTIEDKVYKVYDTWYKDVSVSFGIVGEDSKLIYVPSECFLILDSKTKKPVGGGDETDN